MKETNRLILILICCLLIATMTLTLQLISLQDDTCSAGAKYESYADTVHNTSDVLEVSSEDVRSEEIEVKTSIHTVNKNLISLITVSDDSSADLTSKNIITIDETSSKAKKINSSDKKKYYELECTLYFYCPCEKCCGKGGGKKTATGTKPTVNRTIAVDPKVIPLGSTVYIDGFGKYIAEDTGGGIKGNKIDVFVNSHKEALNLGVKRNIRVKVYK